jgi:hypothetical protein
MGCLGPVGLAKSLSLGVLAYCVALASSDRLDPLQNLRPLEDDAAPATDQLERCRGAEQIKRAKVLISKGQEERTKNSR